MKNILGIIVLSFLLSGNAYAGWFDKLPVLACKIDGHNMTFDLRKYTPWEKAKKSIGKNKLPRKLLMKVTDDVYDFANRARNNDGTEQNYWWVVNRYTGIIDGQASYAWIVGEEDSMTKMLSRPYTFNGTCKGAK